MEVKFLFGGQNRFLLEVEKLINYRRIEEADQKLDACEKRKDLSREDELRVDLLRSIICKNMGLVQESSDIIEQVIKISKEIKNNLVYLDGLILKVSYLTDLDSYDEVIKTTDKGIKIVEKEFSTDEEYLLRKTWFLVYQTINLMHKGKYEHATKVLNQAIKLTEIVHDEYLVIFIHRVNGDLYGIRGEFERAIGTLFIAIEKSTNIQNDVLTAELYAEVAEKYHFMGKLSKGLEHLEKALKIYQEYHIPTLQLDVMKAFNLWSSGQIYESVEIYKSVLPQFEEVVLQYPNIRAYTFYFKGMIAWYDGYLDLAVEFMEEACNIGLELGNRYFIMVYSTHLALILLDTNQIDRVFRLALSSLEDYKDLNFVLFKSLNNEILGRIYHIKAEYKLALKHLEKSLEIRKNLGMVYQAIRNLFHLLNITIDENNEKLYNKYLAEMEELNCIEPRESQEQFFRISKALVLKASELHESWNVAIKILEDIVEEEIVYYPLKAIALINLCELIMNDFSMSKNMQLLEELDVYTKKLDVIVNSQKHTSHIVRLEAKNVLLLKIWLKAQYYEDKENLVKSQKLLDEAKMIASEEGLIILSHKLAKQHEKLYQQLLH